MADWHNGTRRVTFSTLPSRLCTLTKSQWWAGIWSCFTTLWSIWGLEKWVRTPRKSFCFVLFQWCCQPWCFQTSSVRFCQFMASWSSHSWLTSLRSTKWTKRWACSIWAMTLFKTSISLPTRLSHQRRSRPNLTCSWMWFHTLVRSVLWPAFIDHRYTRTRLWLYLC